MTGEFTPTTEQVRERLRLVLGDDWLAGYDRMFAAEREAAVLAEREACAKVVLTEAQTGTYTLRDDLAAAIRARGGAPDALDAAKREAAARALEALADDEQDVGGEADNYNALRTRAAEYREGKRS